MLKIVLDNRLRIPTRDLAPEVIGELRERFTYDNPDQQKAAAFGFKWRARKLPPRISTAVLHDGTLTVPRGGLPKVRAVLEEHGVGFRVFDQRSSGPPMRTRIPAHRVELYDFQERLVAKALEREQCLWRSPQASGKTTAAIAFLSRVNLPTLVIVSTGNLLDQWIRRCELELGLSPRDVGVIQGSRRDTRGVTIGMQQTLWRCARSLRGKFGCVVADEVQLFAANTFHTVVDELDARYVLGVSGDERRADGKEFLIYDQFGSVAAEVTHDELVERGFIHEVEVRVVLTDFRADWYVALPDVKAKVAGYDRLLESMGRDEARNALVVACVREALASDARVIVLSARREHCHAIDSQLTAAGIDSGLLIGGDDYRAQFERARVAFSAGELRTAVGTYQAIGVGFDMPSVECGVLATPVANSRNADKQWRQYRGRFARTSAGKAGASLYYLHDLSVFGLGPLRNLARWNRRVVVRVRDQWIDVREYLKENRQHETTQRDRAAHFNFLDTAD